MKCAMMKYKSKIDFINLETRNTFSNKQVTLSITKCSCGYNHYSLRNALTNNNMIGSEYLRCSEVEMQDYVIKCNETRYLRAQYIKELTTKMLKEKPLNMNKKKYFYLLKTCSDI